MHFIERVKNKSQSYKTHYSFVVALLATLLITVGWSTTIPARFSVFNSIEEKQPAETESNGSPLGGLFNTVKSQFATAIEATNTNNSDLAAEPASSEELPIVIPTAIEPAPQDLSREDISDSFDVTIYPAASTSTATSVAASSEPEVAQPAVVPVSSPEPRVILIATTSAQQTE